MLWLDQPATFMGKVSGFGAQDAIDLPSIAFGSQTTLGYSPNSNNTGGTLAFQTVLIALRLPCWEATWLEFRPGERQPRRHSRGHRHVASG